jgi:hypothetical protein
MIGSLVLGGILFFFGSSTKLTTHDFRLLTVAGLLWFGLYNIALNEADLILAIGGRKSSNTARLAEVGNQLGGQIPAELGSLSNLDFLNLASNEMTGEIPRELGGLEGLEQLRLNDNDLTGRIPAELGDLSSLITLALFRNDLSGEVPAELGQLTSLRFLWIDETALAGALPRELMQLALESFWFNGTDLCEPPDAEFQQWLAGIEDLRSTDVPCENG